MRYRPEIIWSSKSWTHNIFRFYELIFGRKYGIRKESASWKDKNDNIHIELYTLEAICAHLETLIRNFFKAKWLKVEVNQLQFAVSNGISMPWISFAIALDTTDTGTATSTSPLTWSHTVTGSNPFLAIGSGLNTGVGNITTGVTYNSISMTQARHDSSNGSVSGGLDSSVWFLGSSSTGANTISISFNGGTCEAGAVSYSGAQSSNTADASGGNSGGNTSAVAESFNVTTVANNCWVFAIGCVLGTVKTITLPTQTSRWLANLTGANTEAGQDTNGPKTPPGAVSMGWTISSTGVTGCWCMSGASFAPAPIASGINDMLSSFL